MIKMRLNFFQDDPTISAGMADQKPTGGVILPPLNRNRVKGQMQRKYKLISNARFCRQEFKFENHFQKFGVVFEISSVKVAVFLLHGCRFLSFVIFRVSILEISRTKYSMMSLLLSWSSVEMGILTN